MSSAYRSAPAAGLTIIELLITIFIIGTVVTGIFGLFVLSLRSAQEGERRVVAIALANERAEMVRNLPYADVGTEGGVPAGSILSEEEISRNETTYTVRTDIRYIDDPFDGLATDTVPDTVNADYKQARIEVAWNSPNKPRPLLMIVTVAPPGIEGGEAAGTLILQAINAAGSGVAGAELHLTNEAVTPAIDFSTMTDDQGRVVLPGLPVSSDSYEVTVSRAGYTTERTYLPTATFVPDPDHAPLSMLEGAITPKTLSIDELSSLRVTMRDAQDPPVAVGGIAYTMRGTKTIGHDATEQPVYLIDVASAGNAQGTQTHAALPWDQYEFTINSVAAGYDIKETSVLLPFQLNPGQDLDLEVVLVPHLPVSLHVSVANPLGEPVDNATIVATGPSGYEEELGTGAGGQVFFEDMVQGGTYDLAIDAPGFEDLATTVSVSGTTRARIELTPTP